MECLTYMSATSSWGRDRKGVTCKLNFHRLLQSRCVNGKNSNPTSPFVSSLPGHLSPKVFPCFFLRIPWKNFRCVLQTSSSFGLGFWGPHSCEAKNRPALIFHAMEAAFTLPQNCESQGV